MTRVIELPQAVFTVAKFKGQEYVSIPQLRAYLFDQAEKMDGVSEEAAGALRLLARQLGTMR